MARHHYRHWLKGMLAAALLFVGGLESIVLPGLHLEEDNHACADDGGRSHYHVAAVHDGAYDLGQGEEPWLSSVEYRDRHSHLSCGACVHVFPFDQLRLAQQAFPEQRDNFRVGENERASYLTRWRRYARGPPQTI